MLFYGIWSSGFGKAKDQNILGPGSLPKGSLEAECREVHPMLKGCSRLIAEGLLKVELTLEAECRDVIQGRKTKRSIPGRASNGAEWSQAKEWVTAGMGRGKGWATANGQKKVVLGLGRGRLGWSVGKKKRLVDCRRLRTGFERIWGLGWTVGMYGKTCDLTVQKWEEKKCVLAAGLLSVTI
ncbi:hypothetical protein VNO78_02536 [Psophocarpus tetragonolobus]|uniref:Uncharacterized protein n=1 Tax=Psophocarpus tetragonolobus TaxID=3891 RepID=A0AAN9XV81_PSOTE